MLAEKMKFEVWFESKKRSNTFQRSLMLLPKDKFFLGYYDSLKEIVDAFNKEDCVFKNSNINSIEFITDALMKAITRLARTYASSYFPESSVKAEEYNVLRIVDTFNNDKINSTKEVFITNGSVERFEEFSKLYKSDEFTNWKLAEIKNNKVDMLIWIPTKENSIGIVVNMNITPYYAAVGLPHSFDITRKVGSCTENIFSFKELQEIIFGKENKAPIITNKILLSKRRITELLLQGGFDFDEFPSQMSDYKISFDLSFGNGLSKNKLASISAEVNTKEWNDNIHTKIDNGKIKKLILSNGVFEFTDLTEKDKEDLHKYYEWHGEEEDDINKINMV